MFLIGWLALASVALAWLLALRLAELNRQPLLTSALRQGPLLALAALYQEPLLALAASCLEWSLVSLGRLAGRLGCPARRPA